MSFVAAAIAVSAAYGAYTADKAGKRQSDAANNAGRLSADQYAQTRADLAPWAGTGGQANSRLGYLLGLSNPSAPTREQFTTTTAATPAVYSSNPSGQTDRGGVIGGSGLIRRAIPGSTRFDQAGYDAATAKFNASQTDPNYGSLLRPFTGQDLQSEPGYKFGLEEGERGINRAASARGNWDSGATVRALTQFNSDYAGTKYGEAFNRNAANRNSVYGMLSGQSGAGQNAAAQTGGFGANSAAYQGNATMAAGDASAAGLVGSANALTGGVGSYLGYRNNQATLDYLRGLRGGSLSGGGSSKFSGTI